MKKMGRKHRSYFRIVAIDGRQPRDGRVLEELGSYDPTVKNTEERVKLVPDRVKYWLSVGAQPSENVAIFIKKYMKKFEDLTAQANAPAAPAEAPHAEAPQAETPKAAPPKAAPAPAGEVVIPPDMPIRRA